MTNPDASLDDLFERIVNGLTQIMNARCGHLYIHSFKRFYLSYSSCPRNAVDTFVPTDGFKEYLSENYRVLVEEQESKRSITPIRSSEHHFPVEFTDAVTMLAAPIFFDGHIFGTILLESNFGRVVETDCFMDFNKLKFIGKVMKQLQVALEKHFSERTIDIIEKTIFLFFEEHMDAQQCLNKLSEVIPHFLPSYLPLRIVPPPEVQILFYYEDQEHNNDYLVIKATTGSEPINTRVSVKDSISGMLIENADQGFVRCDPRAQDVRSRYKAYLGKRKANIEIKSELVIPIIDRGKIIALMNLEAEQENVFRKQHVTSMMTLAKFIAPIMRDLRRKLESSFVRQKAILYGLDDALSRIGSIYTHGMSQPLEACSLKLDLIRQQTTQTEKGKIEELSASVEELESSLQSVKHFHKKFIQDIGVFAKFGPHNIKHLIQGAVNVFNPKQLEHEEGITFDLSELHEHDVFCSAFLSQHVHNIISNSLFSIREKMTGYDKYEGRIVLKTQFREDKEEKQLNRRCIIKIHDNGCGIAPDLIGKVFEPNYTTKQSGSGLGLFAAKEYINAIGGQITADSELGEFFEISIILDIYDERIHNVFESQSNSPT